MKLSKTYISLYSEVEVYNKIKWVPHVQQTAEMCPLGWPRCI